jgi:hypothetical protein
MAQVILADLAAVVANQMKNIRPEGMGHLPRETVAAKEAQVVPIHHREAEAVEQDLLVMILEQIFLNVVVMAVLD